MIKLSVTKSGTVSSIVSYKEREKFWQGWYRTAAWEKIKIGRRERGGQTLGL